MYLLDFYFPAGGKPQVFHTGTAGIFKGLLGIGLAPIGGEG